MAVITRYIVVRNGVEQDRVFEVKKEADAFDKMLEAAENLATFIKQSDLEIELDDKTIDEIAVVLAKNGPEVTRILRGVRPVSPAPTAPPSAAAPAPKAKSPKAATAPKSSTKGKATK